MKNKFLFFLILSLGLTAFLAGYLMIKQGTDVNFKTGTILDKFDDSQQQITDNQQLTTEEVGPVLLADRRIVSATNSLNRGSVMYFEKNTGKLYEYDLNAKTEKTISDKMLPNFISALWSPTKEEVLGTFTSNTGVTFKYLNIKTGQETALDSNIRSVAFSPDGQLVVHYSLDNNSLASDSSIHTIETGNITISQPDGQYQKKILDTRIRDLTMSWPNRENMAFKTYSREIFLLTEDGKLTKFIDARPDLEEKWSPNGDKVIFSSISESADQEIMLWIKDIETKEEKELIQASALKCVWSIDSINIYCATPLSPSVDEIYIINTIDGSSKLVAEPNMVIREMFLSSVEDNLLFISVADEKLYSIKIPN